MTSFGVAGHEKGYARYLVSNAVVTLADAPAHGVAFPDGAVTALIQNLDDTNDIRWLSDGNDPTASEGMRLGAGDTMLYDGDLGRFRMIRQDAADVSIVISYYGI